MLYTRANIIKHNIEKYFDIRYEFDAPQRCPAWMRKLHLEFLHRIFKEPKKQIKRCLGIVTTLPAIFRKERKVKK